MGITKADLEARVLHLNELTGSPVVPYIKVDGKYKPQANCYILDWAYGGVKLSRMSSKEGCTGTTTPIHMGFVSKRECYEAIGYYIAGIEAGKEGARES